MYPLTFIYDRVPIVILPKTHSASCVSFSPKRMNDYPLWFYCKGDALEVTFVSDYWRCNSLKRQVSFSSSLFPLYALKYVNYNILINTKTKSYKPNLLEELPSNLTESCPLPKKRYRTQLIITAQNFRAFTHIESLEMFWILDIQCEKGHLLH